MNELIRTETEIRAFFDSKSFVEKTCLQINKDLQGIASVEVAIDSENILDQLIAKLALIFIEISSFEILGQFIYRVDLKESEFRDNLQKSDWETLAYLVVRREAQKVFLRQHFNH